jgi:acyl-CoA synthetase (AMP-forming)/AMP-acid ligase II
MGFETMVDAIRYYARTTPSKCCLIEAESGRRFSYDEFLKLCERFSVFLSRLITEKRQNIVVCSANKAETLIVQFATYMAGGVFCPAESNLKNERIAELMEHLDSEVLISNSCVGINGKWIDLKSVIDLAVQHDIDSKPVVIEPGQLSAVIFTTGTSGKAKGVMLSHKQQGIVAQNTSTLSYLDNSNVILMPIPLSHAGGIRRAHAAFCVGATLVLMSGVVFFKDFIKAIDKYEVDTVFLVPAYLQILLDNASSELSQRGGRIKKISIGTALTTEMQKDLLRKLMPDTEMFITYGSTETGHLCSYNFSEYPKRPMCAGFPSDTAHIELIDYDGNRLPRSSIEHTGTITCSGENVMMGYWKDPELTRSVLNGRTIKLADLGYMDGDGFLYIVGRRDDVINTGGNKVAPYEIENLASQIPFVKECVCISVPDKVLGAVAKLLVVAKDDEAFSAKAIYTHLISRLEAYKAPRYIEEVDSLPKASNGKILRHKVSEQQYIGRNKR